MKKHISLLLFFLFAILTNNIFAQKEINEGKVTMEVTSIEAAEGQNAGMLKMLKGSTMVINFNEQKSIVVSSLMGGMINSTNYKNEEDNKVVLFMSAMGRKKMAEGEFQNKSIENTKSENIEVTYDKSDTKNILGYDCYKATIIGKVNERPINMTAYVTEALQLNATVIQDISPNLINGIPLEYSMALSRRGVDYTMVFTATEILESMDETAFNFKTSEYKKVSLDELLLLGGGGMAF